MLANAPEVQRVSDAWLIISNEHPRGARSDSAAHLPGARQTALGVQVMSGPLDGEAFRTTVSTWRAPR